MSAVAEPRTTKSRSPKNATGASRPQGTSACRHCGSPLPAGAAVEAEFCCAGCAYVHRLVNERGFDRYYRLKDKVIVPVGDALFQPRDYGWLEKMQREAEGETGTPSPSADTTEAMRSAADAQPCSTLNRVVHGAGARIRPPAMTLDVQGISCVGCVWLIEKLFDDEPDALRIEINAQLGRLRLTWRAEEFDAVRFARVLQSFNYFVGPPGEGPASPLESRDLAKRIGLCAAFALNVMLFTLPAYFGMTADFPYARLFGTLAMIFGTLSFLSGGAYFLGRALRALRDRVVHIDLPIALGIAGAYAGSVHGWLAHDGRFVYFDFVATFILLMLIGRWAQVAAVERNRRRLLGAQPRPGSVRVFASMGPAAAGGHEEVAVEALRPGWIFAVPMGHTVPVEARLTGADAVFGTAWINGESEPRVFHAGGRVPAGAVNITRGEVRLEALQDWENSLLAQLLRIETRPGYRHRLFERVIRGYLAGILGLAFLTGIGWTVATGDLQRTLAIVTAVLVVSCPCALGLALPLADEIATSAARRSGVFVRENDLWARIGRVRKIIFDKTGTLTFETPALANPEALRSINGAARRALFALVRDSLHPVSRCLHETLLVWGGEGEPLAGELTEETGFGVSLRAETGVWTLGRAGWRGRPGVECQLIVDIDGGAAGAEFCRDGRVLARFRFTETVRADARAEIAALRAEGREVYILSGDRREKVAALARELNLPPSHGIAEVSPREKAAWVWNLDRHDTLMLGDGANDSLAFERALCRGTPVVHRGLLEQKADFYYLGRGIGGIRRLLALNRARARTQRAIIAFSIAYNLLAVGLAAGGLMSPLLAAVLMPASSLVTLAVVGAGMGTVLKNGTYGTG